MNACLQPELACYQAHFKQERLPFVARRAIQSHWKTVVAPIRLVLFLP